MLNDLKISSKVIIIEPMKGWSLFGCDYGRDWVKHGQTVRTGAAVPSHPFGLGKSPMQGTVLLLPRHVALGIFAGVASRKSCVGQGLGQPKHRMPTVLGWADLHEIEDIMR